MFALDERQQEADELDADDDGELGGGDGHREADVGAKAHPGDENAYGLEERVEYEASGRRLMGERCRVWGQSNFATRGCKNCANDQKKANHRRNEKRQHSRA